MNARQVQQMFLCVAEKMVASEEFLTEIDNKIGDGDHGIGMAIGFKGVYQELENKTYTYVNEVFHAIGMTMLCVMGGASGVLFGTVFISGIVNYPEKKEFVLEDFANIYVKSLNALKKRGKAQVGDKTMIDALEPACLGLKKAQRREKVFMKGSHTRQRKRSEVWNTRRSVRLVLGVRNIMERKLSVFRMRGLRLCT